MTESDIICVWNRVVSDFEIWLRLEKGLMPNSIDAYLHDVAYLSDYAAANSLIPEQITLTDLQNFLKEKAVEAEFCDGEPVEWFVVLNVIEGFSA